MAERNRTVRKGQVQTVDPQDDRQQVPPRRTWNTRRYNAKPSANKPHRNLANTGNRKNSNSSEHDYDVRQGSGIRGRPDRERQAKTNGLGTEDLKTEAETHDPNTLQDKIQHAHERRSNKKGEKESSS